MENLAASFLLLGMKAAMRSIRGDDGVGRERGTGGNWSSCAEAFRPLGGARWPLG